MQVIEREASRRRARAVAHAAQARQGGDHRRVRQALELALRQHRRLGVFPDQGDAGAEAEARQRRGDDQEQPRRPGGIRRRAGPGDDAGVRGVDPGLLLQLARAHEEVVVYGAARLDVAFQLAQADARLGADRGLLLELVEIGGERALVGLRPLVFGLRGLGDPVELAVDELLHVLHLGARRRDERMPLAEVGAQIRLLARELGILPAQAVDHRGLDRLGRRAGGERTTAGVLDALEAGARFRRAGAGRDHAGVAIGELLLADEASARGDQAVPRLVVLQPHVGLVHGIAQVVEARAQLARGALGPLGPGLALVGQVGFGDGVDDPGGLVRIGRGDDHVHHEDLVGALHRELAPEPVEGLPAGVDRPFRLRPGDHLAQRADGASDESGGRGAELGVLVEPGLGDGARQHGVRLHDADLALDLRDAAIGRKSAGIDVIGHDHAVARIDQQLRGRGVEGGRDHGIGERRETEDGCGAEDQLPAPEQDAPHVAEFGRRFRLGRDGALGRHRLDPGRYGEISVQLFHGRPPSSRIGSVLRTPARTLQVARKCMTIPQDCVATE